GVGDVNGDGHDDLVVGAPDAHAGQTGEVYLYTGLSQNVLTPSQTLWEPYSNAVDFGATLAPAGDVNGDGYADVIIGDPGYYSGLGGCDVYRGAYYALNLTMWTFSGGAYGQKLGQGASTIGGLNRDGFGALSLLDPH